MPSNGYPRFPRGMFNHFSKDLSVVDYYIAASAAEKSLKEATQAHAAADYEYSRSDAKMVEIILDRLTTLTTPVTAMPDTPDVKAVVIRNAVERVKHATRSHADQHSVTRGVEEVAFGLLPYFSTFDRAAFAAFAKPITDACTALKTARSVAAGTKGDKSKKYRAAIAKWDGIFVKNDHLNDLLDSDKPQEAYNDAKRLIETWQSRARMFASPVTVEGTSLNSLPDELRAKWIIAYNKLGFGEMKRNDLYTPFKYRKNEDE